MKMNDWLDLLDEEYKALLEHFLHEVQLTKAVYDLRDTLGN